MTAPTPDRKPPQRPDPVAQRIAADLGETEAQPLRHIGRILATVGEERALGLLRRALEIEQRGGMLLPDGSRRWTPGGVFFRLVREQASPQERARIWPRTRGAKPPAAGGTRGSAR